MSKSTATVRAARSSKVVKASAPLPQSAAPAAPALTAIEQAKANVQARLAEGLGVTLHTSGAPIKGLAAEAVVARPQRKMLRVIDSIIGHPGKGNCIKRFHLYAVGQTLLHAKVTPGLVVSDVTFYAECGYLTLRDATDEEYAAAVAAWEAGKAKPEAEAQAA